MIGSEFCGFGCRAEEFEVLGLWVGGVGLKDGVQNYG